MTDKLPKIDPKFTFRHAEMIVSSLPAPAKVGGIFPDPPIGNHRIEVSIGKKGRPLKEGVHYRRVGRTVVLDKRPPGFTNKSVLHIHGEVIPLDSFEFIPDGNGREKS